MFFILKKQNTDIFNFLRKTTDIAMNFKNIKSALLGSFFLITIAAIAQYFLPWWVALPIAAIIAFWQKINPLAAFVMGFATISLLWGSYATWQLAASGNIVGQKMGALFGDLSPGALISLTSLLGGWCGGLGALTGAFARGLFVRREKYAY